jgi:hypothetical protein
MYIYSIHRLAQNNLHVFYVTIFRSLARQLSDIYDVKSLVTEHTKTLYVDVGWRSRFHYKYSYNIICNGPTNALVCNKILIQMSHTKILKITPTCFDHQMIIRELSDPG